MSVTLNPFRNPDNQREDH